MRTYSYDDIEIKVNELPPQSDEPVALDTEFFGQDVNRLHRPHGKFASLAATFDAHTVYIITEKELIEPFMARLGGVHIWHNALYDITQLRAYFDYRERTKIWDTMLVEQIMFGGYYYSYSLADLARRHCDIYVDKSVREEFGEATEVDNDMLFYAAVDVCALFEVANAQLEEIDDDDLGIWKNIERDYLWTVASTQGIPFDVSSWQKRTAKYRQQAEEIDAALPFNPRSWQQIKNHFAENYGIKLASTNEETMSGLLLTHPNIKEVQMILDSRWLTKAAGTYGDNWLPFVEDGRVYPAWRQIGTETGRMSVGGVVGIQTVPKLSEYRSCFIALPGHKLGIVDYSSQEPRIFAHLCGDEKMKQIFIDGRDYYLSLGEEIFETNITDKKDPRRNMMKSVSLGATYGMTQHGLSTKLGITKDHAQELLDALFHKFPGADKYAREANRWKPYVTTIMGRKFWGNKMSYQWSNNYANAPIQGSAADANKMAANLTRKRLGYNPFLIYMHDEIVAMFPDKDVKEGMQVLVSSMIEVQETLHPDVPGGVDPIVSSTWNTKE